MRRTFSKNLNLRWKKSRSNDAYVNTNKNIRLRQIFALRLIEIMQQEKVILNFDESVIKSTNSMRYSFDIRGQLSQRYIGKPIAGLSLMLAVSSIGDVFFWYLDGNNNEVSVAAFIIAMEQELSRIRPSWRETHVVLLDNCASHKTQLMREVF